MGQLITILSSKEVQEELEKSKELRIVAAAILVMQSNIMAVLKLRIDKENEKRQREEECRRRQQEKEEKKKKAEEYNKRVS